MKLQSYIVFYAPTVCIFIIRCLLIDRFSAGVTGILFGFIQISRAIRLFDLFKFISGLLVTSLLPS